MKTATKGLILSIIFVLALFIVTSQTQKSVKKNELNGIVARAIQETQRVINDQRYEINSNDEYLAEFSQNLVRLSSACDNLEIKVYGIDYEKGLIDVEVSIVVKYVNSKEEVIKVRKTSILDVLQN